MGDSAYYDAVARWISGLSGIEPLLKAPAGVEVAERWQGDQRLLFVLNHTNETQKLSFDGSFEELLTGKVYKGDASIVALGVLILMKTKLKEL
jgi:beta-galactosidase